MHSQEIPMKSVKLGASVLAMAAVAATAGYARDNIQTAGSSTVLPYATIVAEAFGENFGFKTPVVESGGSGAGRKKLCEGVGENTIDIANSSSRITQKDLDSCAANGVTEVMEVRFGYDGIVFASDISGPDYAFTPAHWFNAIGAQVVKDGALVANTNKTWDQVDPALGTNPISAYIPGTKHGTREVFDTKVIEAGCKEAGAYDLYFAASAGADEAAKKADAVKGCHSIRTDGMSVDIDGDYTETLARISANKTAIGVFGLSFYQNNTDKLKVATMNGVIPTVESVAAGEYPVSRPLFFYVKKAHIGVIPGLQEYIDFFVSDDMAGPNGPLAAYGLVPDPELAATQAAVAAGTPMGPLN
jgi:phosphate transport system substrate-binding protein